MTRLPAVVVTPMAHRAGMGRLVNSTMLGGTLCIIPQFDAEEIISTIEREKITVFGMVPTVCRMLMPAIEAKPERCYSLRRIAVTGEAFPVALKKRLIAALPDARLVSFFGMTEAGGVTYLSHEEQFTHPEAVGRPSPGVEVRIVSDAGKDVALGEVGELLVRTGAPGAVTVMKEYFNRPEQTAAALRDGWFYTGDMAREDADGYIYIADRKKDMIVSGGFNVYSKEVEQVISEVAGVRDAAVVGIPDDMYGEAVVAFVERSSEGQSPDEKAIVEAKLAEDMKPFSFQIQTASDTAKNAVGRLTGGQAPSMPDTETSFAELKARLQKTIDYVQSVPASAYAEAAGREVEMKFPNGIGYRWTGAEYLTGFVLPNFFFHVSMAYAILRNRGVKLGKPDFLQHLGPPTSFE